MFDIGILNSDSDEEKFRILILNQIGCCGIFVMQFMLFSDIYKRDLFQIGIDLFLMILVLIIVILSFCRLHFAARLYFTYFLSFASMMVMIVFGNQMKFEFIFFLFAMTAIVFFDKKSSIFFTFAYVLMLFVIQKGFLYSHDCLITFKFNFIDQLIPFFSVFVVTFVILNSFKDKFISKELELRESLSENQSKNKMLQDANEELERFAHVASHDLKSPLRTVVSFLNLIERKIEKKDYESIGEYIQFAKKGGELMNNLVDDILQFSKFSVDDKIYTEQVDFNEVIENIRLQLSLLIAEKNAIVVFDKLPSIVCNKVLVSLLFQNLIENALKYNESNNPRIAIVSEHSGDEYEISFTDNGIGIAPEYHEKIFNLFTRLNADNSYQGSGMGLAICRKIADKLNAKISVKSDIGIGSTFIVTFFDQNV